MPKTSAQHCAAELLVESKSSKKLTFAATAEVTITARPINAEARPAKAFLQHPRNFHADTAIARREWKALFIRATVNSAGTQRECRRPPIFQHQFVPQLV